MHDISVETDVLEANRELAEENRNKLDEHGIYGLDISGAIGSGKTSLIEEIIQKTDYRCAVIAGDVISDIDADRIRKKNVEVVGASTGKECHLDAHLIKHALQKLSLEEIDLLLMENVGNLICPVDFDLGAHKTCVVVSVTEGDDIVEKHPMIFHSSDCAVINKTDLSDAVQADPEKMQKHAQKINPSLDIFPLSIKKQEGVDEFINWLEVNVNDR